MMRDSPIRFALAMVLGLGCSDTLRVADWPDASGDGGPAVLTDAGEDAARDAGASEVDAGVITVDAGIDAGEADSACPPPWLLVALSAEEAGRVVRFSLNDGPAIRCEDLDAEGELDATLLDVAAVDERTVVVVSDASIQLIDTRTDRVEDVFPFAYESDFAKRAVITVLDSASDPVLVIGYGEHRGALRRFARVEGGVLRELSLDLPRTGPVTYAYAMTHDLDHAEHLLVWSDVGAWRVDASSGVTVAQLDTAGSVYSAHAFHLPTPTVTLNQSLNITRARVVDDALETEWFDAPAVCPFALAHVVSDPMRGDHVFTQCDQDTVLDITLATSFGPVMVSAASEGATAIHGIGIYAAR